MIEGVRRVRFNLGFFLEELDSCLSSENRHEEIDDVVQTYKDFLRRLEPDLGVKVRSYVDNHPLVTSNIKVKSFVQACYS